MSGRLHSAPLLHPLRKKKYKSSDSARFDSAPKAATSAEFEQRTYLVQSERRRPARHDFSGRCPVG